MPAITTFVPFMLFFFQNQLSQIYYGNNRNNDSISLYISPMQDAEYEPITLYAEAATRFFQANGSDENHLIIEEVKIFFNANNGTKMYFRLEEDTREVKITHDSNNSSFFVLLTTPKLHTKGQFRIAYKDSTTLNVSRLVMTFDSPPFTQAGPYKLVTKDYRPSFFKFEIRGKNTDVPLV